MKIKKIWFEDDNLCGEGDDGKIYRQSLLWYPGLRNATEMAREDYEISTIGIHWRKLDEDVSFESFMYEDAEPTPLQRFFLTHEEINIAGFAKSIGIDPVLLRKYINGNEKPSKEREEKIIKRVHELAGEYAAVLW